MDLYLVSVNDFHSPAYYYEQMDDFRGSAQQHLEFDGTTVLCRVCGDKASGFHYGVHSCEGCKGFFRRSIQQKIQYRSCTKNQQCSILRINRNRCQYCRLKKCITVGMSRDAVRFGRVPKREKAKILAAMQASHIIKTNETVINEELTNTAELKESIINAHFKTCDFTRSKIEQLIKSTLVETNNTNLKTEGGIASATLSYLTCPLNPKNYSSPKDNLDDNFSDRFSPAIRGVVEFAKLLPGFSILTQDDQIILLKSGVFEVLLLRLSNMFLDDKMICINGKIVNINNIEEEANDSGSRQATTSSAKFLIKSMFKFTNEFNQWNLSDNIIGIFSSMIIMSWDRPGLQNPGLVKKIQSYYRHVLLTLLPEELCNSFEAKIPELRTLNTLHSAKLLSFKMGDGKVNSDSKINMTNDDYEMSVETDEIQSVSQPNSSNLHHCPFNNSNSMLTHFPVSPSNDSGIESGAGSSPSRSETNDPPIYNIEETMPVLKRALLAPPIIDNQHFNISTSFSNFVPERIQMQPLPQLFGFSCRRDSSSDSSDYEIGHKKFRRGTLTPPMDMTRTRTPSPLEYLNPRTPERIMEFDNHNQKPETVVQNKSPVQLYPQLASALTRPIMCVNVSVPPEMSTLKQSLLKPPMTCNAETSDYIHSLIMKNEFMTSASASATSPAPVIPKTMTSLLYKANQIQNQNQIPLNLCMKLTSVSASACNMTVSGLI